MLANTQRRLGMLHWESQRYREAKDTWNETRRKLVDQDSVYDVLGREVKNLADEGKTAGVHTLEWDGRDDDGGRVPRGIYFYRLVTGDFVATRKLIVLK